jgi:transcriptional regulator with XRE-family HTH domain
MNLTADDLPPLAEIAPLVDGGRSRGELLGDRLRELRKQRGWTLSQVSARTGLAISTLSKLEHNQISLTYQNLVKLADGLDLELADLFTPEAIGDPAGRKVICRYGSGRLHETANYAHEYLCAEILHRKMVPLYTRVKTRSINDFGELIRHPGEEFVFVLEGAVDFYVDEGEPTRLRAGDSCYFDARQGHAFISVGVGDAVIVSVLSSPRP